MEDVRLVKPCTVFFCRNFPKHTTLNPKPYNPKTLNTKALSLRSFTSHDPLFSEHRHIQPMVLQLLAA